MKQIYLLLTLLVFLPSFANAYVVWENSSVIITTTNGTDLRNVTTLNVSIYYDNLSNIWRAGKLVVPTLDGIYIDYVTFNASGRYIAIADINDTGTIYRRFIYITVEENNEMLIAITMGLIFTTLLGLYLAKDAYSKPSFTSQGGKNEMWNFKDWGAVYAGISILSVVVMLNVLAIATNNSPFDGIIDTVAIVGLILFGLFALMYMWYFFQHKSQWAYKQWSKR